MATRKRSVFRDGKWVEEVEQIPASEQRTGADIRKDGTARRMGPGTRSVAEYFDAANARKEVTRQEFLGLVQQMEHARLQNRWYRKLWRWATRVPGPVDMPLMMAIAYEKSTVEKMRRAVEAELERRKQVEQEEREGPKLAVPTDA